VSDVARERVAAYPRRSSGRAFRGAPPSSLSSVGAIIALAYTLAWGWSFTLVANGEIVRPGVGWPTHFPALMANQVVTQSGTPRTSQQSAPLASVEMLQRSAPYRARVIPCQTMRCTRCGITFHPAALHHDRALLLASCCPRCDGHLVPDNGRAATPTDAAHSTTSTVLRRSTAWASSP
jgi:hypothetical protein